MAQMTQDLAHEALRTCGYKQHPALTINETEQLLRAWLEREVLRAERDHARETVENAMKLLVGIHALLNPPPVVAGGSVYRFDNPNANDVLQLLSDRIRDVPHHLAVLDAALRQEQPAGEGEK